MENTNSTLEKFARKSSVTGKGMNEGYVFEMHGFYCEEENEARDKAMELGYNSLEEAYKDEAYYWTQWEEIEEDENYYDADGNEYNPDGSLYQEVIEAKCECGSTDFYVNESITYKAFAENGKIYTGNNTANEIDSVICKKCQTDCSQFKEVVVFT
ncbi:hypothetical protein [Flavobacterium mekongense]|uniref:hypothetical protein n=1 Tax=Flavobacterium mekongense TaxID=3379707 RepID=UPI0039997402